MLGLLVQVGCWRGTSSSASASATGAAPVPGSGSATAPSSEVQSLDTSSVTLDACPDSKQMSSKLASREVEELVGPCTSIPGGAAHFSATLLPNGRVELASPSGDRNLGVVPTCLVQSQNQLKHKLRLAHPCRVDVRLEERGS